MSQQEIEKLNELLTKIEALLEENSLKALLDKEKENKIRTLNSTRDDIIREMQLGISRL